MTGPGAAARTAAASAIPATATALLVIDMQRFFAETARSVLGNINELIAAFHKHGMPVVYTQHGHTREQLHGEHESQLVKFWGAKGSVHRFSPEWALLPALEPPADGDILVQDKDTYDAFLNTRLEETLHRHGVRRVLVTGVITNFCCETTARSAFNRAFETWSISDACGAQDPTRHQNSLSAIAAGFGEVMTTAEAASRLWPEGAKR